MRALPPYTNDVYEVSITSPNSSSGWAVVVTAQGQQSLGVRLSDGEGSLQVYSPGRAPTVLVYATYETRADQLGCRTPA